MSKNKTFYIFFLWFDTFSNVNFFLHWRMEAVPWVISHTALLCHMINIILWKVMSIVVTSTFIFCHGSAPCHALLIPLQSFHLINTQPPLWRRILNFSRPLLFFTEECLCNIRLSHTSLSSNQTAETLPCSRYQATGSAAGIPTHWGLYSALTFSGSHLFSCENLVSSERTHSGVLPDVSSI